MNIMLTDLTSLTLEQSEVSMVVESDAGSFSSMFSQQLPETPEKEGQGIDFKDFLEKLPIQTETSEITPELPLVANDSEFPLHDLGRFSRDSNPGVNAPPEPVVNIVKQMLKPDADGILNASTSGEKGELLPIGGNLLPDDAGLDIARQVMFEKTVAPSVTLAAGSEVLSVPLPQVTQALSVAAQADGVSSLQGATIGVVDKGVTAADFVAVMGKSSAPQSDQVIARNKIVTPESPQTINNDLLPGARLSEVAGIMRNPDVGTAPPPSRPLDLTGLALQPAISAVAPAVIDRSVLAERIQKGLNENVSRDVASTPVGITDKVLPPAEKVPVADILSARDMLNTPEYRNPEFPAQPSANTSQQSAALSTSAVQTFSALPHTLATTAQSGALPPHLATLTLARNAGSTELGGGLSERVNWMINQKQNTATIRLDPPFLGKLDVQIKIADDATTIVFQTQHAQTRDLIESASVRLRDFLQESGYQNVNVDVSQRQDQQQARSQTSLGSDADQQDDSYQDPDFDHQQRDADRYFIGDGIVDTFA